MNIYLKIGIILLIILVILNIIKIILGRNAHYKLEKNIKSKPSIAILIPARNESLVIKDLLDSLIKQTYQIKKENIYIIVEDQNDKTVKIAKEYKMNIFVRKNLDLKTKGYALDELIKDLEKKHLYYDLYFIFDADNVLDKDFIKQMVFKYLEGYRMALGYRDIKNKDNEISISSWLTFLLVNEYRNLNCKKHLSNMLFSGTGFYISGSLIRKWKSFPFHSLTEDYECSIYATLNEISTSYNPKAIFYDTQPNDYKTSIKQRSRWIKGYMTNWFKNIFKLFHSSFKNKVNKRSNFEFALGIIPGVLLVGSVLFILIGLTNSLILTLLIIYLMTVLLTIILINNSKIKLKKKLYLKTCLYHPIFLLSYLHAFIIFLFKKDLGWDIICHKKGDENEKFYKRV